MYIGLMLRTSIFIVASYRYIHSNANQMLAAGSWEGLMKPPRRLTHCGKDVSWEPLAQMEGAIRSGVLTTVQGVMQIWLALPTEMRAPQEKMVSASAWVILQGPRVSHSGWALQDGDCVKTGRGRGRKGRRENMQKRKRSLFEAIAVV